MLTLPEEANFAKFLLDVGDGVLNDDDNNFSHFVSLIITQIMNKSTYNDVFF